MTFLNPTFLWALFAIAIPVIVHFFNFRRPKKVLFSNISLVKEVKRSVVKRIKLKQWLLLLTRILAITALVMLFANPVLVKQGESKLKTGAASVVIILDDSYSMKAGNEKGPYWQQGRALAEEILKSHGREDEFLLCTTSKLKLHYSFTTAENIAEELEGLEMRQNTGNLNDVLKVSSQLFANAAHKNKRLYVISDFQQATVLADSSEVLMQDTSVALHLLTLATRDQQNAFVDGHRILNQIIDKNSKIRLELNLVNDAATDIPNVRIQIRNGAVKLHGATRDLKASNNDTINVAPFQPPGPGWHAGVIEIDDTPVNFDNKRYFSYFVPESEKVLVVEGRNSFHLKMVFKALEDRFEVDFVPANAASTTNFSDYQSVVLLGVDGLSSTMKEKLTDHLEEGKGVLFFPGANMDLSKWNDFFIQTGIGKFGEKTTLGDGIQANTADLDHPVFSGVFKSSTGARRLDGPVVHRYYPLQVSNGLVQNQVLDLRPGTPLLLESRPSNGLFYTFSIFPDSTFSDFHVKSAFAPMVLKLTQLMNYSQFAFQNQNLGDLKYKRVNTKDQSPISLVRIPDSEDDNNGEVVDWVPRRRIENGNIYLVLDEGEDEQINLMAGNYNVIQNGEVLEKLSFNIDDAESRMKALGENALGGYADRHGLDAIVKGGAKENVGEMIRLGRSGVPLWKYFLIAGLLFLLFEVILVRIKEPSPNG